MAILRKHQRAQYTVIDNTIFRDKELSNKALGMLCRMLSLPDGWEFSVMGLAALSNDGKSAVMSQLDELEEHGYLVRNQVRIDGKIAGVEYIVSETRMSEKPYAENQHTENQHTENQHTENPTQSITNISNTEISNTTTPTIYDVRSYVKENGLLIDPDFFFKYYETAGWVDKNGKRVKNWKLKALNWNKREVERHDANRSGKQFSGLAGGLSGGEEQVQPIKDWLPGEE